jgi:hypothetical protein
VTEEFEGGLTLSKRSAAEEASPHYSEPVTSRLAPSAVANVTNGIAAGAGISTTVVAGGPPTVGEETGVSHLNWQRVERPHLHLQRFLRRIPLLRTLKIVEFRTDPELRRQS